jgi:hypothetical protein
MKQMLEHLINVVQKDDLETMFGEGSKVKINDVYYITNNKKIMIDSTIYATFTGIDKSVLVEDVEHSLEFYPYGLHLLIQEGWKYIGIDMELIFLNKLDVN